MLVDSAIQVTGGAAGAIVIEDPKDSIPDYLEEAETRLLVLQQIATAELAGISGYAGDTTFHVDDAKGLPANWKDQVSSFQVQKAIACVHYFISISLTSLC